MEPAEGLNFVVPLQVTSVELLAVQSDTYRLEVMALKIEITISSRSR